MTRIIVAIAAVGVLWGGWPLVMRASGLQGAKASALLAAAALVPVLLWAVWNGQGEKFPVFSFPYVYVALAGVMMGVGLVFFNYVAASRLVEASVSIPVINVLMLLVTVTGAIIFFRETISLEKALGIALLVGGIWLLKPQ